MAPTPPPSPTALPSTPPPPTAPQSPPVPEQLASSPSPPLPNPQLGQSPPPPSPPVLSPPRAPFEVVLRFTASNDVEDYTPQIRDRLFERIFAVEGVQTPLAATLEVQPGSVVATVTLSYDDEQAAVQTRAALSRFEGEASRVEALLLEAGLDVAVTDRPSMVLQTGDGVVIIGDDQEPASTYWLGPTIAVFATLIVLAVLVFAFILYRRRRRRPSRYQSPTPKQHARKSDLLLEVHPSPSQPAASRPAFSRVASLRTSFRSSGSIPEHLASDGLACPEPEPPNSQLDHV